jgi:hypothetical protein
MNERKSWASSLEAKQSHALFECLTHNLLLLFEERLIREEGIQDEVETKKQTGRTRPARLQPGRPNLTKAVKTVRNFIHSAVHSAVTRATQRTQRFIRWVRVRIYQRAPWSESLARLRHLWTLPPESFPHRSIRRVGPRDARSVSAQRMGVGWFSAGGASAASP